MGVVCVFLVVIVFFGYCEVEVDLVVVVVVELCGVFLFGSEFVVVGDLY